MDQAVLDYSLSFVYAAGRKMPVEQEEIYHLQVLLQWEEHLSRAFQCHLLRRGLVLPPLQLALPSIDP
jgi:hypothetical protein